MLGSFKRRLLLVIVLVTIVGLIMQSGDRSRQAVEPVLRYIMTTDYPVEETLGRWFDRQTVRSLPVDNPALLKCPCDFVRVERHYGWHWDTDHYRQGFFPGISLQVKKNTPVYPVFQGEISKVDPQNPQRQIVIDHGQQFLSYYGGLEQIMVKPGERIQSNTILGKTGDQLYFEIRTEEGPVDPHSIFK